MSGSLRHHREDARVVSLEGRVFARPDGRTLSVPTVYRQWHRLLVRAGVPIVRPHDARHTTATLMLSQGVHPKLVSEMLGHATVSITLDLYSHATASMHREAASTLDALLRAPEVVRTVVNSGVKGPILNTDPECRGRESNPYAA